MSEPARMDEEMKTLEFERESHVMKINVMTRIKDQMKNSKRHDKLIKQTKKELVEINERIRHLEQRRHNTEKLNTNPERSKESKVELKEIRFPDGVGNKVCRSENLLRDEKIREADRYRARRTQAKSQANLPIASVAEVISKRKVHNRTTNQAGIPEELESVYNNSGDEDITPTRRRKEVIQLKTALRMNETKFGKQDGKLYSLTVTNMDADEPDKYCRMPRKSDKQGLRRDCEAQAEPKTKNLRLPIQRNVGRIKENHAKGEVLNKEIKENSSENMLDHIVSDPNAKNISKPTCSEGGKSLKKLRTLQPSKGTALLKKSAEMRKIRIGVRANTKNNRNRDMPPPLWRRVKSDEKGNKPTSEKKIINPKSVSINEEAVHVMSNTQLTGVGECK